MCPSKREVNVIMATTEGIHAEGIPLTEAEKNTWADIEWADHNDEVQANYAGQWVALYRRSVVAHGTDREQVLAEGIAATQRPKEELTIWPIMSRDTFLADSPPSACDF